MPSKHFMKFLLIMLVLIFSSHLCYADANEDMYKYSTEGINNFKEGRYQIALENYLKSLELAKKLNYRKSEAAILSATGNLYHQYLLDFEKAYDYYNQAISLYNELGNIESATSIQGHLYVVQGHLIWTKQENFQKSRELYLKALAIGDRINNLDLQINAFEFLLLISFKVGDSSEALIYAEKLLKIYQEHNIRFRELDTLYRAVPLLRNLGDYDKALNYCKQALMIAEELNDLSKKADVLLVAADTFTIIGDYQTAMEYAWTAINIANKLLDKKLEAKSYETLASIYEFLGDYEKAIDNELSALNMLQVIDNDDNIQKHKARIYTTIAKYYKMRIPYEIYVSELLDKAMEYYVKAFDEYQRVGDFVRQGEIYSETASLIAPFANDAESKSKVIDLLQRAIKIHVDIGVKDAEMKDYYEFGDVLVMWSDYVQSLEYLNKGLELSRTLGDPVWESDFLQSIGYVYKRLGDYEESTDLFEKALKINKDKGSYDRNIILLNEIGLNYELAKKFNDARKYYSEAISLIEATRGKLTENLRISYSGDIKKILTYTGMIHVLMELNQEDEAFNYMERAKARTFLDLLGTRFRLQDKNIFEEERGLQFRINYLSEKIKGAHEKPDKNEHPQMKIALEKQLTEARTEYVALIEKIKKENPEISTLLTVNSLTLKQVQDLLDPETTLLEYFITPDKTLLWVVGKSDLKVIEIEIKDKELKSKVTAFREKIAHLEPEYSKDADELYDLLIKPAKEYIKTKRIGIVPHSVLHYLPFHALLNKDKFLIEEYEMFYTPSASVLKFVYEKRKEVKGGILAFGNPDLGDELLNLPYAEDEVKQIKSANPGTAIYLKDGATEDRAKKLSSDYNVLHFASHGELNPAAPMFSSIRLAKDKNEDGRLEVNEIFNLNLKNTSLVTLSACETGLGKLTNGDELIGLSRGFIYAGTPSIVASLWRVNDQSTSQLMNLFYENLKTHPKSESLRKAQLEMIRGKTGKGIVRGVGGITSSKEANLKAEVKADLQSSQTVNGSHPYFWAPFILIGDWK